MDKRSKIIIGLFGVILLVLICIEIATPQPVNWSNSYTSSDKIPLGAYVLYQELEDAPHIEDIQKVNRSPYDFLIQNKDNKNPSTYLFINSEVNFDPQSYTQLIQYIRKGNTVFIAANSFGKLLQDSLAIATDTDYQLTEEKVQPVFFSPYITTDTAAVFKKRIYKTVFKSFDTTKTTVLGHYKSTLATEDEVNFIKIQEGKGALYLNTLPEAYTNYYLLKPGTDHYAATTLSFLPHHTYFWDDYLKDGRKFIDSPMRFVLSQVSLQWAYYILGIGLLIYIIFRGKREQRIIPVLPPLQNDTLAFTQTVGALYMQHEAYRSICQQKITYFLERIRTQYYLDTTQLDDIFSKKLAAKTGHSLSDTKALISFLNQLQGHTTYTEADVIALHTQLEEFIP